MADNRRRQRNTMNTRNTSNSSYSSRLYQYSSEAYELAPEYEEFIVEIPREMPARRRKAVKGRKRSIQIKKRLQPTFVTVSLAEKKVNWAVVFSLCVLFCGIFSYILILGEVSTNEIEISRLTADLSEIRKNNVEATNELYQSYDLNLIEKIATTKLGMVKPGEHQKIYIEPIMESYFATESMDLQFENSVQSVSLLDYLFTQ